MVASRMESTGVKDKIHISKQTADLLIGAGKNHWITFRPDEVNVKGKGMMQTFFLVPSNSKQTSTTSRGGGGSDTGSCSEDGKTKAVSSKRDRMVNWAVEMILESANKMVGSQLNKFPQSCFVSRYF
jgi:Adenylate and Guanylate cyclase catalytic domain